jgi:hypothetical protein
MYLPGFFPPSRIVPYRFKKDLYAGSRTSATCNLTASRSSGSGITHCVWLEYNSSKLVLKALNLQSGMRIGEFPYI